MKAPDPAQAWHRAVRPLQDLSRLTLAAALALAAGLTFALAALLTEEAAHSVVIDQTRVVVAAEHLASTLKDLETGERGYALTGAPDYLQPYDDAVSKIPEAVAELAAPTPDYHRLADLLAAKQAFAGQVVAIRRNQGLAPAIALIRTGRDKALMDSIRVTLSDRQAAARAAIARSDHRESLRLPVLATSAALLTLGAFALIWLIAQRRRRAERASADLLGTVLDHAPIGLGFVDTQGRLRDANRALAAMNADALGGEPGRTLWDTNPAAREPLEGALRTVLKGGQAIAGVEITARTGAQRQRDYEIGFFPLPQGDAPGAGLVVADATTRQRAERRLRDSEARYRTLIETSAAIVWTTTPDGLFHGPQTSWTSFTGQTQAECENLGWQDVIHEDDRDAARTGWAEAIVTQALYAADYRLRRADGEYRIMAARAVPITDEGEVREWVGTHTDITDRRRAEEELTAARDAAEAANRAKSQFLANMSHELRTPLSAVIGYSEMIEEEMQEAGQTHLLADVQKIQSNARHLLSLINDVLDLSKIEADRMTVYGEDFAVETLIRDVAGTVGPLVAKKGNTLVLDLADDLGTMHSDQVKLRQCLFNLVSNAAKFTEAGCITLRATRDGDRITLSVADSGIGMTPEQLDKLFQRFSQADISTTRKFGGTGLGLAITRAFARLLGGDVDVTSVFGEGSTFTITIPDHLPDQIEEATPSDELHPALRQTVLVIEDDGAQRDLLTRFLEREGFAVRTAPDGKTGLDLARALHPSVILLDVMMPRMDGWSVLTALKADSDLAKIPVVMVTFVNEPALGASLGAADTILKPVEWPRLRQVMERFHGDAGHILIVDDDPDARARIRTVLERDGWTTQEAANGQEALDRAAQSTPQLILLDLTMPLMDGFAFLHELRRRPNGHDIPVVVLTARDLDAAERSRLDGADRVLSKGQTDLRRLSGELRALTPPGRG